MYCLFENKDDLKVEIEGDSKLNYSIIINGNKFFPNVDYSTYLKSIQILNDGYVFVNYGEQGMGPRDRVYILDSNGTVTTNTGDIDYILNNGYQDIDQASIIFENNKLFLSNTIFGDGGIGLTCSNKKINSGWWPEYDQIVYVEFDFEYIGNGKISEINHSYKSFSERLNDYYGVSTCEEYWNR